MGAVVPTDTPAVAAATSAHLAARGTPALHTGYVAHIGYAGYPFAGHLIGKREAESEADPAIYIAGRAPVISVGGLTTYANGAQVPTDTPAVAAATAAHLATKGTPILQDVAVPAVAHVGYADTLDGHMVTTLESVKLTVMLTLDTDMDSDMDTESNTSQLLHLLEV